MAVATSDERIELAADQVTAVLEPGAGGRLSSLTVGGRELLVGPDDVPDGGPGGPEPIAWGLYPMAPWAGRIAHGRFTAGGVEHRLPLTLPPHAIHGTAYTSADWRVTGPPSDGGVELVVDLGDPWPWPVRVGQRIELAPDHLRLELSVTNAAAAGAAPMPASLGWHPWFRRHVGGTPAELRFDAAAMYELDDDGIPTGRLVPPPPGPWDDCFTDLAGPPVIAWPGTVELTLHSGCSCWVVYDRPPHALCVEPQTDAPDAANRHPRCELPPGGTLTAWFEIRWRETP